MRIFTTDHFVLPLQEGHRFPMLKYQMLRERVAAEVMTPSDAFVVPKAAGDDELLLAHTPEYLERVKSGTLSIPEIRRIGFPWSEAMVERCRRSCGATIEAAEAALADGVAVNLAGGTHHAFADAGEGFCVFNDTVVAARSLQSRRLVERVLVIDCDVHQGNGTAAIVRGDDSIFAFSIHGANNFPYRKVDGDLDIALDDGTVDADYLNALQLGLDTAFGRFQPDLAIYLAGADPYLHDRLGRMAVSKQGLADRDRMVLGRCWELDLPVAVTMAGGYANDVADIVDIHVATVAIAAEKEHSRRSPANR